MPHLVPEEELVPADEDLPQPLEDLCAVDHLVANELLADEEEDLGAERCTQPVSIQSTQG